MIITINGTPGSGKTTLAKALAKKYKFKFYSVGKIRRIIASFFDLTIDDFNKIGERHSFSDTFFDEMLKHCIKKDAIIDGRLAWYFFPKSIKILVLSDPKIAARRIFKEKRGSEKKYKNVNEVENEIRKRISSDIKRYKKYYGIRNLYDIKNYDIVMDTSNLSKKEMIKVCIDVLDELLRNTKNKRK